MYNCYQNSSFKSEMFIIKLEKSVYHLNYKFKK